MTLAIAEALNPIKPNYKQYCTVLNQILATAEREYYEYRLNKNKGDLAKSWRVLKEIIGLNKGWTNVNKFVIGTQEINDKHMIAKSFNNYFVNIGPTLVYSWKCGKLLGFSSIFRKYLKR